MGARRSSAAGEAVRVFAGAGRVADAALARYWLAYGTYLSDNEGDARTQLQGLLAQVRAGLQVEPEFEMRLLTALAAVEARVGEHARARWPTSRRRGSSPTTWTTGAAPASCSTSPSATASRVTWRRPSGSASRASPCTAPPARRSRRPPLKTTWPWPTWPPATSSGPPELASEAHTQFEEAGDSRFLSAVLDTEAQIALAGGKHDRAFGLAARANQLAHDTGNRAVEESSLVTAARISAGAG